MVEVALSGDAIVTKDISNIDAEGFLAARDLFRDADVAYTHLESTIGPYDAPEVYPASEGGGTYLRSPPSVAEELDWFGIDIVSHPGNHTLDFAYGGLRSTWDALDAVGLPFAGTGKSLAEARSPTYLETGSGRVALVSMTSSYQRWASAGEQRRDLQGRPGVNPLGYQHVVDSETVELLKRIAKQFGWWVVQLGDDVWEFTPSGLHGTRFRYRVDDEAAPTTVPMPHDRAGNLKAIREADANADIVLVHIHAHEFDPAEGYEAPPQFIRQFAEESIDAGADVFLAEGSHNPRAMDVHDGSPIFYDLGDLFLTHEYVRRLPTDFYRSIEAQLDEHVAEATPAEAFEARATTSYRNAVFPEDGYWQTPVDGSIVPICSFGDDYRCTSVTLYPCIRYESPHHLAGLPALAPPEAGTALLEYVDDRSGPDWPTIEITDGVGSVDIA